MTEEGKGITGSVAEVAVVNLMQIIEQLIPQCSAESVIAFLTRTVAITIQHLENNDAEWGSLQGADKIQGHATVIAALVSPMAIGFTPREGDKPAIAWARGVFCNTVAHIDELAELCEDILGILRATRDEAGKESKAMQGETIQ